MANLRRGAIAIVRKALNHDRHLVRREAFIGDQLNRDFFIGQSRAFLDGTFDSVSRDGTLACLLDRGRETRIQIRIGAAQFRGDHDFAHELDDHLAALLRVRLAAGLFPLCTHDYNLENAIARRNLNARQNAV